MVDRIYVIDKSIKEEVYIFDNNGKFINNISKKGKGPKEYSYLSGADINEKGDVIIYDRARRQMMYFDKNGHYINKNNLIDYRNNEFVIIENDIFLFYMHCPGFSLQNEEILITDNDGKIIKSFIERETLSDEQGRFSINNYFCKKDNGVYFIPVFSDKILKIKNGELSLAFDFNISDEMASFADVTEEPVISINDKFTFFIEFHISDNEIFVARTSKNKIVYDISGDIKNKKIYKKSRGMKIGRAHV